MSKLPKGIKGRILVIFGLVAGQLQQVTSGPNARYPAWLLAP